MDSRSIFSPSKNGPSDLRSPITLSSKEPPACVQNAMMNREKKPFTYLPGGLDLSQIKSEKMARRLMINALSPGVQEKPRPPSFTPNPDTPPIKSSHYFNMPVAVFPCIQIPANPKELLRRTSGPFNRSESIEKTIPEKKINGITPDTEPIKIIAEKAPIKEEIVEEPIVKELDTLQIEENNLNHNIKSYSPIIHDITEFKNDEKLQIELPIPNYDLPKSYTAIIEDITPEIIEDVITLPNSESITSICYSPIANEINVEEHLNDELDIDMEIKANTPVFEEKFEDALELLIPNCDSSIKSYTPSIDDSSIDESIPNSEPEVDQKYSSPISESISESISDTNEQSTIVDDIVEENVIEENVIEENVIENNIIENNIIEHNNIEKSIIENNIIENNIIEENITEENIIEENIEENIFEEPKTEVIEESEPIIENCDIILDTTEPMKRISPICSIESIINELNLEEDIVNNKDEIKIEEEERIISPMRRSTETIKGLTDDLDSLPSLNICTKRFSFLRDSPTMNEEVVEKDDPYSIITGIPPKISLIDKKVSYVKPEKVEPVIEVEPVVSNTFIPKTQVTAPSPFTNGEKEFWKKDLWNSSPDRDPEYFLKDDPEPAWKKEIREIAMRKAEAKEESVEYNVNKEPPWKRELRELTQAREAKLLDTNEITLKDPIYESPWGITNNTFYRPTNAPANGSAFAQNPSWSQTVRPKTWKERNGEDLQKLAPVEAPDWKKTPSKHFMESFIKKQLSRSNSNSSEVINKTPEITVEVVNQPNYTSFPTTNSTNNGYVYPWESSSESSIAFSPEPRTPTPQSRNSPFTNTNYSGYSQNSVAPREYGTLSFQPRRNPVRSCPIQSRSFKYLQLLTGTDDSYEDDEPFIPQPPQHAYPKPGNF